MAVIALAFILFILLSVTHTNRTKTPVPPKRTQQVKETDQLIDVILPIINSKK